MDKIYMVILVLIFCAFVKPAHEDKDFPKYEELCIEGVQYLYFRSHGVTPKIKLNGMPEKCGVTK